MLRELPVEIFLILRRSQQWRADRNEMVAPAFASQRGLENEERKGIRAQNRAASRGQRLCGELAVLPQMGQVHCLNGREILKQQAGCREGSEEVNAFGHNPSENSLQVRPLGCTGRKTPGRSRGFRGGAVAEQQQEEPAVPANAQGSEVI